MSDVFKLFADGGFRFGHCFVRAYDRHDVATFGTNFLHELYDSCVESAPSRKFGTLSESFCGMSDLSADSICSYLHTRSPLLLMCVDRPGSTDGEFDVIGFSYPTIWAGPAMGTISPDPGRSMLLGYTYFRQAWRTPEMTVSMMLTGIYFFHTFNLLSLIGQRLPFNHLTFQFLKQFGLRDVGRIPNFLLHDGKMVDCVISALNRLDFENYVRKCLAECFNGIELVDTHVNGGHN